MVEYWSLEKRYPKGGDKVKEGTWVSEKKLLPRLKVNIIQSNSADKIKTNKIKSHKWFNFLYFNGTYLTLSRSEAKTRKIIIPHSY